MRADEEPASGLIEAMRRELTELYDIPDGQLGTPLTLEEMCPPGGGFLVGFAGDQPVAGGGLRTIGPEMGEVKRMYVAPEYRGKGLARRLLAELEDLARWRGMTVLRLDTGPQQPHAQSLYESEGYEPIDNYNDNPHAAFWGEKLL
jgi:GNAT superfamily N-acetyltransferase